MTYRDDAQLYFMFKNTKDPLSNLAGQFGITRQYAKRIIVTCAMVVRKRANAFEHPMQEENESLSLKEWEEKYDKRRCFLWDTMDVRLNGKQKMRSYKLQHIMSIIVGMF